GLIALPLLVAALLPLLARLPFVRRVPWLPAVATALFCCVGFAGLRALAGEATFSFPWIPAYWIDFSLRLDGLAFLFALLITAIGVAILGFSARYLPHDLHEEESERRPATFYAYVL